MPIPIKITFSIIILGVAIAGHYFLASLGQDVTPYLALFLGVFSVIAFWIFPEVEDKSKKN